MQTIQLSEEIFDRPKNDGKKCDDFDNVRGWRAEPVDLNPNSFDHLFIGGDSCMNFKPFAMRIGSGSGE